MWRWRRKVTTPSEKVAEAARRVKAVREAVQAEAARLAEAEEKVKKLRLEAPGGPSPAS